MISKSIDSVNEDYPAPLYFFIEKCFRKRSFYVRIIIHRDRNNFIIITSRVNGTNFSLRRIDSINFRIDSTKTRDETGTKGVEFSRG